MKTWIALRALALALTLISMPALAQERDQATTPSAETAQPAKDQPNADPSASPTTGGDTKPSAVDPAQATTTGANAGEGASYNRSSEKGESVMPKEGPDKTK